MQNLAPAAMFCSTCTVVALLQNRREFICLAMSCYQRCAVKGVRRLIVSLCSQGSAEAASRMELSRWCAVVESKTIGGIIACRERSGSLRMALLAVWGACARMLLYPSVQKPVRLCNSGNQCRGEEAQASWMMLSRVEPEIGKAMSRLALNSSVEGQGLLEDDTADALKYFVA